MCRSRQCFCTFGWCYVDVAERVELATIQASQNDELLKHEAMKIPYENPEKNVW